MGLPEHVEIKVIAIDDFEVILNLEYKDADYIPLSRDTIRLKRDETLALNLRPVLGGCCEV